MEFVTKVIDSIPNGSQAFSVRFERPESFSYLPGQYMFITIGSGETALTKHLTISSSPTESFLQVTKEKTGHPFSNALEELRPGDNVILRGPYGEFTFTGEYGKVVFITRGIGITPFRSMAKYAADKGLLSSIIIVYSAKSEERFLFREEFTELGRRYKNITVVTIVSPDMEGKTFTAGINQSEIEEAVTDWRERIFFTSGPSSVVERVISLLREMKILSNHIRTEYFPGY